MFWLMSKVRLTFAFVAYLSLTFLNFAHPFIHHLELGSLDAALPYLNMWAMQWKGWRNG